MNSNLPHFEKYSVAPCPSRDYYGIKIFNDKVILYLWKVSYGPHLYPIITETEFSKFPEDKSLKEEIEHVFGLNILNYINLVISGKTNTLLTLPIYILQKFVKYLNLEDIAKLFCVSQLSKEIFDSNYIWESYFKKLKKSSELTDMEKNLGVSQGFKQLVKDQHLNNMLRKSYKYSDEKTRPKSIERNEKLSYSLDTNISNITGQNDYKTLIKKRNTDISVKKVQRPIKYSMEDGQESEKIYVNKSKKNTSETKKLQTFVDNNFNRFGEGEIYPKLKLVNENTKNLRQKKNNDLQKIKFINENNDQTELLLQKNYLKTILSQIHADEDAEDLYKDKSLNNHKDQMLLSPRSNFTKTSDSTHLELKAKTHKKNMKESSSKKPNTTKFNIKTLLNEDKNDSSDGLSYLMKKYLQSSNEALKKVSETDYTASSIKNQSIQSNFDEIREYKLLKKVQKSSSSLKIPKNESSRNTRNLLLKIKNIQKV